MFWPKNIFRYFYNANNTAPAVISKPPTMVLTERGSPRKMPMSIIRLFASLFGCTHRKCVARIVKENEVRKLLHNNNHGKKYQPT
jgi:hypothetical protein